MAPKLSFQIGDRILALNKKAYYEAKVITECIEKNGRKGYMVHYQGWNKRYDEFIAENELEERTKPFSEEALVKAREEQNVAQAKEKAKKRKSIKEGTLDGKSRDGTPMSQGDDENTLHSEETSTKQPKRPNKRKHEEVDSKEGVKNEHMLTLPQNLKVVLAEDYDHVMRHLKVYNCPAKFNIDTMIDDYLADESLTKSEHDQVVLKYANGKSVTARQVIQSSKSIRDYFNILLPRQLLYKFEKPQYNDAVESHKKATEPASSKKKRASSTNSAAAAASTPTSAPPAQFSPSAYYGLPHLLRFLTRFEDILKHTSFNERILDEIFNVMRDFVGYLSKNQQKYFNETDDYIVCSPEYQREAFV